MKINPGNEFKYIDYSNNLFTKIQLVNILSLKETEKLNEKYKELGLFIKLVNVDNFGNIKNPEFLNKKRLIKKSRMSLQEFYNKYYLNEKLKKPKKEKKPIKQNNKNNYSYEDEFDNDEIMEEEQLEAINNNLKEIYNDCQNIKYKKCKIDDLGFKEKIIEYIGKFKKYISKDQYSELFNKWKNENMKIKGVDPFNNNDLEDFKIPILKAFKSEIVLLATTNLLGKEKIDDESEKKDEEKDRNENERDSESDNSEDNEDGSNNAYFQALLEKLGNNSDEE